MNLNPFPLIISPVSSAARRTVSSLKRSTPGITLNLSFKSDPPAFIPERRSSLIRVGEEVRDVRAVMDREVF
jgi:hypothetical protein